jgi:hypothetical protein
VNEEEIERATKHISGLLVSAMVKAFWMGAACAFATFMIALAVTTYAKAHSWYELECCDTRDCEPIPADQVKVTPEGFITPDGQLIPFASARVSADRDYHWCKYQKNSTAVIWPHEKRACFYAPAGGM